jgi:TolA-binding protein
MGKNDKAIEAYDLTIRTYPKSSAVPEATYKKGLAHQNLRQMDAARIAFETVVKNYPDTIEALLAKQKLEQLSPPAPKKP